MELTSTEPIKKKNVSSLRKRRKLIIVSSSIAGFILALILTAHIIAEFLEQKIKDVFLSELNKNLQTQITFRDFDLSLLDHFPMASLQFYDVVALDATPKKEGVLLKAEVIGLQFNIFDLIDKNYTIKEIEILTGALNIRTYPDGTDNYHFWKQSTDTTDSNFRIALSKIKLKNIEVKYIDQEIEQDYLVHINESTLKGEFTEKQFIVQGFASAFCKHVRSFGINYCKDKAAEIKIELKVDNESDKYTIQKAGLSIGKMKFTINGYVINREIYKYLNLSIQSNQLSLQELMDELPGEYQKSLTNYKGNGILDLKLNIKGLFHEKNLPEVKADFKLHQASVTQINSKISIEQLNLSGSYTNGKARDLSTSLLSIPSFSATLKTGNIKGSFQMQNFNQPNIALKLNSLLNLKDVKDFFGIDTLIAMNGNMQLDVSFKGTLAKQGEFTMADFRNGTTQGEGSIGKAFFLFKGSKLPYQVNEASFAFNNNDLDIRHMKLAIKNSDFKIAGVLKNLIPYMLSNSEQLSITGSCYSKQINLNELLADNTSTSGG